MAAEQQVPDLTSVQIAVSRGRALERALIRLIPAGLMLAGSVGVISNLNFAPNPLTNRITEYCLTLVMLPVGLSGVLLAFSGLRWFLTAMWPGRLEIVADASGVTFHVGPMGSRRYALDGLSVRYPFDMEGEDDEGDAVFESLLEPPEQMATLLPRMEYEGERERLDRRILYFTRLDEAQAARMLRPFVRFIRC